MNDHHDEFSAAIPRDEEAEKAVIGACLVAAAAFDRARKILTAEDFYKPAHEIVWTAMIDVAGEGRPVDPMTVLEQLRKNRDITRAGGGPYLHSLYAAAPVTETVGEHARIVRELSTRRQVIRESQRLIQRAGNGESDVGTLAADAVTALTAVRDRSTTEVTATFVGDLLEEEDSFDWLVEELLERRDRLIITGAEGAGKTTLLRQIAVCLAAGLHPLTLEVTNTRSIVLFVDAENSRNMWRRKVRPMVTSAAHLAEDPRNRIAIDLPGRIDITADRDLSRLHALADYAEADVLCIGPLYRLVPRAIQTDDDAAPVLAALDTFRDRGMTILIEAHAGHAVGRGGNRDLRPRGSSALLGWPEFGIGIRQDDDDRNVLVVEHWRGERDEREWPNFIIRGGKMPFRADPDCYSAAEPSWTPHTALQAT